MLDDSIVSSPSKCNVSIQETRLKRKSKRSKKVDLPAYLNSDHDNNGVGFSKLINEFYKDSEDEDAEVDNKAKNATCLFTNPSAIIRNYNPFQFEKSLVMADHMFAQEKKQNKSNVIPNTPGFSACSNLNEDNLNAEYRKTASEENNSFVITESELITCCDQAEKILQNAASNEKYIEELGLDLTPDKNENMLLVNSILEDFSQSPLGKGQIVDNTSWQYTPEFRLRRKPVKNYSRKFLNSTKANLNQSFEEHVTKDSSECDDGESSFSSLSMQEDVTFGEHLNEHPAVAPASNTQRLCENLLNLTEYYTQNDSHQSLSDDQHVQESTNSLENVEFLGNVPDLINDILSFRLIHPNMMRYDSYNSIDDFHGFHSKEHVLDSDSDGLQATNLHIMHVSNAYDDQRSSSAHEKEAASLNDWNEDGYHDIFACIDTENILEDNMHLPNNGTISAEEYFVPNSQNKKSIGNPSSNSASFKTASAKPIKVSKEAQIMVAKILSKLPDLPEFKDDIPRNSCKEANIFEDPEDYEWNDDCDLFLNFQTPIALNECPANKLNQQQSLKYTPQKQDGGSTSKKRIHISQIDQNTAQKALKEFYCDFSSDGSYEDELREMKLNVYKKNHNLQTAPSSLSVRKEPNRDMNLNKKCDKQKGIDKDENSCINSAFNENNEISSESVTNEEAYNDKKNILNTNMGFQTANGQKVVISEKSKHTVKKLLQEFETLSNISNYENDLKELKTKIETKIKDLNSKSLSQGDECDKTLVNEYHPTTNVCNKLYSIPEEMHCKRKRTDYIDIESENEKHDEKKFKNSLLPSKSSFSEQSIEDPLQEEDALTTSVKGVLGFKTARGRNVQISQTAQNTVLKLLNQFNCAFKNNDNYEEELKVMKFEAYAKTHGSQPQPSSLRSITELNRDLNVNKIKEDKVASDKVLSTKTDTNERHSLLEMQNEESNRLNMNMGFRTANGNKLEVSANAKHTAEKLLQKFEANSDIPNYEMDIKELKAEIQTRNKELKSISVQEDDDYTKKINSITKTINSNKINSTDCSDLESHTKTLPVKVFKNGAHTSKSSFVEQSLKSPLLSAAHSLILRKNLSLTKRRKRKLLSVPAEEISEIDKDICDLNDNIATPIKSCISLRGPEQTLSTPNLKEFLSNYPLTSTPIISKTKRSVSIIEDSDLKPITWNNNNDSVSNKSTNNSMRTTKLSESSTSNVTLSSSNPTAKERIGRLKMYGKAPAVSPILIENNHSCRPSGLRRTRRTISKKN